MSKRGMRAAGVCLVTVAVMSGSVVAGGAVASSDSPQRVVAKNFSMRFSATPTRVVLSPNGGKTAAEYRIVVRHPRRIDQIDSVAIRFEKDGGFNHHFRMRGIVVSRPSATRTVLTGRSDFISHRKKFWTQGSAEPGAYTPRNVELWVTKDGESSSVNIAPPTGRIRVNYATKLVLREQSESGPDGRVRLEGSLRGCSEDLSRSWEPASGERVKVMFLKDGTTEPRKVSSTRTDNRGRFTVAVRAHRPGRWWVRFPGNRHMDASRSTGYSVDAS